jgi:hypothetical protein
MGRNCNCAFKIVEFAFKILEGAFKILVGAFKIVEGAFKIVVGAFKILEGAFANDEIPFIKGVVTVTGTFFDFITVEIRSLYIPVLFAGGRILYFTGSICPRVGVDVKVRSLGAGASKLAAHKKPINLPIIIISSKKIIKKFLYTIKISKSKYMEK